MAPEETGIALGEGTVAAMAVEEHRAGAVESVIEGIYRELHDELAPFGEHGREYCRRDIHSHLDYLGGSLVAGDAAPFGDYLTWLHELLRARGVPTDSVALSVDLLGEYFRGKLPPERYSPIGSVLESGKRALMEPAGTSGSFRTPSPAEHDPALVESLADTLVTGEQQEARALVESVSRETGYLGMAVGLVQPAMYRIGERWQAREINVAQEHLATALAQKLLVQQFTMAETGPPRGSKAVFACVESNHHTLGLRMVADAYELDGWSVEFLGADTPTRELLERLEQARPELVGLSLSMIRQLPRLKEAIDRIRARFPDQPPRIVAGGLGLIRVPGVADRFGLDGWSSSALTAIESL